MVVTVLVDATAARARLQALPEAVDRAVARWLPRAGQLTRRTMVNVTRPMLKNPKGLMLASVRAEVSGGEARVGPNVPYARWVNSGTQPHIIRARNAKALTIPGAGGVIGTRGKTAGGKPRRVTRFTFGGKVATGGVRFAKFVRHPGFSGYFFVEKTADAAAEPLARLLEEDLQATLGGGGAS